MCATRTHNSNKNNIQFIPAAVQALRQCYSNAVCSSQHWMCWLVWNFVYGQKNFNAKPLEVETHFGSYLLWCKQHPNNIFILSQVWVIGWWLEKQLRSSSIARSMLCGPLFDAEQEDAGQQFREEDGVIARVREKAGAQEWFYMHRIEIYRRNKWCVCVLAGFKRK